MVRIQLVSYKEETRRYPRGHSGSFHTSVHDTKSSMRSSNLFGGGESLTKVSKSPMRGVFWNKVPKPTISSNSVCMERGRYSGPELHIL